MDLHRVTTMTGCLQLSRLNGLRLPTLADRLSASQWVTADIPNPALSPSPSEAQPGGER